MYRRSGFPGLRRRDTPTGLGQPCSSLRSGPYSHAAGVHPAQLEKLDGKDIERSERIVALQRLPEIRKRYVEEAAARPPEDEDDDEDSSEDEEDEEDEEEDEDMDQFQRRPLPDHIAGGKIDNYWAAEREKAYGGKFQFVRNSDEEPTKGMIVAAQVPPLDPQAQESST